MKKSLLIALAGSLLVATQLKADNDLYITGSTAFRANVHDACTKLFTSYTEYTGTAATGGDSKTGSKAAQWTLTGTPIAGLTTIQGSTFTIHALFNGSIGGAKAAQSPTTGLWFLDKTGSKITNSATIAFSDVSTSVTPYPVDGSTYNEEPVAVQPFVMCRSTASALSVVTNITQGQLLYLIKTGKSKLSVWSGNPADRSTAVYAIQRTKDSGSRLTLFKEVADSYNSSANVYIYTNTTIGWVLPSQSTSASAASVVGSSGNNNWNYAFGPGFVGGGDVSTALNNNNANNLSVAVLSFGDAKGVTGSAQANNWTQVIAYNGTYPTVQGAGIAGNGGTNDFTPITLGQYTLWAPEVCVYPVKDPSSLSTDQNLSASQLGNQTTAGTILGVLDAVTTGGGTPVTGSIDNEIELSKTAGATAIRYNDMLANRAAPGGTIVP